MKRFSARTLSPSHLARVLALKSMLAVTRSASPSRGRGASVVGRRQPRSQREKLLLPREHREARARRKPSHLAMTSHMASRTRHATSVAFGATGVVFARSPRTSSTHTRPVGRPRHPQKHTWLMLTLRPLPPPLLHLTPLQLQQAQQMKRTSHRSRSLQSSILWLIPFKYLMPLLYFMN